MNEVEPSTRGAAFGRPRRAPEAIRSILRGHHRGDWSRLAFDGLAILLRNTLGHDPLRGSLDGFGHRRRDRIKLLLWEPGGYWLCLRRLEPGPFRWPTRDAVGARYRREELTLWLVGIELTQTRPRKWCRRDFAAV